MLQLQIEKGSDSLKLTRKHKRNTKIYGQFSVTDRLISNRFYAPRVKYPKKLIALLQLQRNNIKINIQMLNRIRTNQKEKYKKKKNQLAVRFGRFGSKQLRIN